MSNTITWVHDEMLSPAWVGNDCAAVFVFDEDWIREEQLSQKRIVFIYECLLEMPGIEVRRGNVVKEVQAFANSHDASVIRTLKSPLPRIKQQGAELAVEWIEPEPLVALPQDTDLKRFSRYWRRAEKQMLRKD